MFHSLGTTDEATATISVDGPCEVTGADFIRSEFESEPRAAHCNPTEGGHLTMSMRIGYGRGYVSYEANKRDNDPIGVIHVDSRIRPSLRQALSSFAALASTPTTIALFSRSRPTAPSLRVRLLFRPPISSTSIWLPS